jgi:hypothetical protein
MLFPVVTAPPGWTAGQAPAAIRVFLPPDTARAQTYEAVLPPQPLSGSLEQTASVIWHALVGNERIVDAKGQYIRVPDGATAYEVLVATIDANDKGIYRIFILKQYGDRVAAGELRSDDVERVKAVGKAALASLEAMRI